MYRKLTDLPSNQVPDHEVLYGYRRKKLENNTMFYRGSVQIDKDWSNIFIFFCSRNKSGGRVL